MNMMPFHKISWFAILLPVVLLTSGCGQFWMPSEKIVYERACEAIERSPEYPIGTKLHSIDKTRMYIGKSAGRIDIPCDLAGADGELKSPTYVVQMKRVARTWIVETIHPPRTNPEPFQTKSDS
jgi:hypothetical protein